MWSLWLARNEKVFCNNDMEKKVLNKLILVRSFKWAVSNNWLDPSQEKDWERNPQGSILAFHQQVFKEFWEVRFRDSDLVATIDGSWSNKWQKGGIGGIIKDKNRKFKVLFSGPVFTYDSFSSELEALRMVLSTWSLSHLAPYSISIFSDSKQLVDEFEEFYYRQKTDSMTGRILSDLDLNPTGLCLKHIKRDFNREAHELAKRGKDFHSMRWSWAAS